MWLVIWEKVSNNCLLLTKVGGELAIVYIEFPRYESYPEQDIEDDIFRTNLLRNLITKGSDQEPTSSRGWIGSLHNGQPDGRGEELSIACHFLMFL